VHIDTRWPDSNELRTAGTRRASAHANLTLREMYRYQLARKTRCFADHTVSGTAAALPPKSDVAYPSQGPTPPAPTPSSTGSGPGPAPPTAADAPSPDPPTSSTAAEGYVFERAYRWLVGEVPLFDAIANPHATLEAALSALGSLARDEFNSDLLAMFAFYSSTAGADVAAACPPLAWTSRRSTAAGAVTQRHGGTCAGFPSLGLGSAF